ncbi:hypothetical protein QN096_02040 [Metapseudomonas otitidis]|uniref:hypothetical protein n=1 Tax=Metapseudomonas otitidis TaxID=319939 RepID=UPI0025422B8B|nr:hypothetical protein [Pseudomonas otitidis]WIF67938.1 hypothetical protein QN096_02040 [Pseudomonas otitidis]
MKTSPRLLPLLILGGLASPAAHASYDFFCSPTWALVEDNLNTCSNLPFLSPGNDSRANLKLLLADAGRLSLPSPLQASSDYEGGYAQAPFALNMLNPAAPESEVTEAPTDVDTTATESVSPRVENLSLALEQIGVKLEDGALAEQQFAEGEGSRCRTNNLDTTQAFVEQLASTSGLSAEERKALAISRVNLLTVCGEGDPQPADVLPTAGTVTSADGQAYLAYLTGADAFYRGDFGTARERFTQLADSPQPWIKEAALYLKARVSLNQAQEGAFDEYGIPDLAKVDRTLLDASDNEFKAYLTAYPEGAYAASARGLLRRIYWLLDDNRRFAAEFAWQFAQDDAKRNLGLPELVEELDVKLLPALKPEDLQDTALLAMADLMRLRRPAEGEPPLISLEQLQAQKQRFADRPALHAYLVAAWHFYRGHDAAKALAALPAEDPQARLDLVTFSQETLRGLALEAKGDAEGAYALWQRLLQRQPSGLQRGQLELAIALNRSRVGQVDALFTADSPVRTAPIREILLRNVASADLLRRQAVDSAAPQRERDTALFTLLYKDLVFGDYAAFLKDQPLIPSPTPKVEDGNELAVGRFAWTGQQDGYACPSLTEVATRLQGNAKDAQAGNCLGEFIRTNGFDGFSLNTQPPKDELGGSASQFPGKPYSRLVGYMAVIDDAKASDDDRAYALYRAVNCYAPAGYNTCDGQDISKAQRKQWFQALKTRYAKSPWAEALKYYW